MKRALYQQTLRQAFDLFVAHAFEQLHPGTPYLPNWHIEAISWKLDQIRRGECKRLIITVPPRSLKSFTVSVAWPAYLLGQDPTTNIMTVSYGEELSIDLARQCRRLIEETDYRHIFPKTRLARAAVNDLETTKGGRRISATNGGVLTGRGGHIIIIDDPQKPDEAQSETRRRNTIKWFENTLSTRLNDKENGAIILIQQRLHEEDLAGHLLARGGWDHLDLPAIAERDEEIQTGHAEFHSRKEGEALHPERESFAALERQRQEMGSYAFSAQYQQRPVPETGNLIRPAWFKRYEEAPEIKPGVRTIQSWDFAVTDSAGSDYTVCLTALVQKNQIFIFDIFRDRLNYPAQKKKYAELGQKWLPRSILVEKAANGQPLLDDLRARPVPGVVSPIGVKPSGSKVERLSIYSSRIEAGDVYLPRDASWLDAFIHEIAAFPNGKHDDQVDALSQLLQWLKADWQSYPVSRDDWARHELI
ncbi:phage terminase large subunit [Henriciella marina]|uniref:phage terminase large subunit n=1 Tax=Henriciella marina TaxID=453851 RepID=UPI000365E7A4|nr:phage terminase large subunit [Henriciella marina]